MTEGHNDSSDQLKREMHTRQPVPFDPIKSNPIRYNSGKGEVKMLNN